MKTNGFNAARPPHDGGSPPLPGGPGALPWMLALALLPAGVDPGPLAAQAAAGAPTWSVEDVLRLEAVADVALSPAGRLVAFAVTRRDLERNETDSDVWVVPYEGGDALRLTYAPGSDDGPRWAPDGSWLAFLSDRDGVPQVWGIDPRGGEAWQVTSAPRGVRSFRLSPDGRRVAWTALPPESAADSAAAARRGRPIVWDSAYASEHVALWAAPLEARQAGAAERRSPDGHHVDSFAWAPDSRLLAWGARPGPDLGTVEEGAVWVAAPGGAPERWTRLPGGVAAEAWVDGLGLLVSGPGDPNRWTRNRKLWLVAHADAQAVDLTGGLDESVSLVAATPAELLVEAAHRTGRRLWRVPLRDGRPAGPPEPLTDDARYYAGFSASVDVARLAFLAEDATTPPDIHATGTRRFQPRRLTRTNPWTERLALGKQQVVSWRSRDDGEPIEGVLTLPVGWREGQRAPLLLIIHGGPAGVSGDRFGASRGAYPAQVFAGLGYAVLQPNYRGSTGYGERFRHLIAGDISGGEWIDIDSGVDHLIERGIADPDRLGVMGWSYGGHQTYWGITQTGRYRAASAGAGPNDLISMYSQTDITEFYHTYLGPKPWEDWALWESRSAYRRVANVTTPLLIQVGEKDERVPAEQSIQFHEALKRIGKAPTKLVLYPGQPHGVREPLLQRDLMERNVAWFARWIPTGTSGPPVGAGDAAAGGHENDAIDDD